MSDASSRMFSLSRNFRSSCLLKSHLRQETCPRLVTLPQEAAWAPLAQAVDDRWSAPLVKFNFMGYSFTTPNRNHRIRSIAILLCILVSAVYFSGPVWGESDKDYAEQFRRQGRASQEQGDFGKALFYFSRAAAYLPDDAAIQNDLGLMYEQLGKLDDAEASYRSAIEKDTRYLPAYSNLGILFKKRGNYEFAAMYLQRRIELGGGSDPWVLSAQEELEDLYRKAPYLKNTRTLESASELERQIAQDKTLAKESHYRKKTVGYELALRKGLDAFKTHDYPTAIASFEEALRLKPDSSEAQHALDRAQVEARKAEVSDSLQATTELHRDVFVNRELSIVDGAPEAPAPETEDQ